MSMSKTQAIKDLERNTLSNQQALVSKIEGSPKINMIKRTIPGGKHLLETVRREDLSKACYTWLRHCAFFSSFTVSFVKDVSQFKVKKTKVQDFNDKTNNFEWDLRGKKWLGEVIAQNLLRPGVLAVEGEKNGLYVYTSEQEVTPENDYWEPYIEFTPFKPGRV